MKSHPGQLQFELPSTLEAIEHICSEFTRWREATCAGLDGFATELLLREALTNSVVHGCAENPSKLIRCVLRPRPNRLVILVRDEGEGFDWRAAWNHHPDLSDAHGRGIEIFKKYANAFRFNPKGNSITLIKRFNGNKTYE